MRENQIFSFFNLNCFCRCRLEMGQTGKLFSFSIFRYPQNKRERNSSLDEKVTPQTII